MRIQRLTPCCTTPPAAPTTIALIIMAFASLTRAGFTGGVENFSGTTLDTATWQSVSNLGGAVTQNNGLTLTTPTGFTDYTTKTFSIGVGQKVRTSFKLSAAGGNYGAQLSLIQGPLAAQNWSNYANAFTLWGIDDGSGNTRFVFDNGGGGNNVTGDLPLQLNTTYTYEISYDSASSVTGSVYDSSNALLGSFNYSGLSGEPASFLIDLANQNSTATFANVVVSATPEPASVMLLAGITALFPRLRKITPLNI